MKSNYDYDFCCFCREGRFQYNKIADLPGEEGVVYRDENIFVIPDIAPVVESHFLAVSEEHKNSFGGATIETNYSLEKAKKFFMNLENVNQRRTLFLEHGSSREGRGICIDHAHLHMLHVNDNICSEKIDRLILNYTNDKKVKADLDVLSMFAKNDMPYVYYEMDGKSWVYHTPILPRQFTRKLLSNFFPVESFVWNELYKTEGSKNRFKETLKLAKPKPTRNNCFECTLNNKTLPLALV